MNDESLAQKIMSEVFRDPTLPKGAVNLNVEEGRAVLRGEVATADPIGELERRVRMSSASETSRNSSTCRAPVRMHQHQSSGSTEL